MFIRTDRSAFHAIRGGHLVEVDAPTPGEVTIEWRARGSTFFLETLTAARIRATQTARARGLDPDEVLTPEVRNEEGKLVTKADTVHDQFERLHLAAMMGREGIYKIHGAPGELAPAFATSPASAFEMLGPTICSELGRLVMGASMESAGPFVSAGSGL